MTPPPERPDPARAMAAVIDAPDLHCMHAGGKTEREKEEEEEAIWRRLFS